MGEILFDSEYVESCSIEFETKCIGTHYARITVCDAEGNTSETEDRHFDVVEKSLVIDSVTIENSGLYRPITIYVNAIGGYGELEYECVVYNDGEIIAQSSRKNNAEFAFIPTKTGIHSISVVVYDSIGTIASYWVNDLEITTDIADETRVVLSYDTTSATYVLGEPIILQGSIQAVGCTLKEIRIQLLEKGTGRYCDYAVLDADGIASYGSETSFDLANLAEIHTGSGTLVTTNGGID